MAAGAWKGKLAEGIGEQLPVEPGGLMLMVTQHLPHFVDFVEGAAPRGLSFKQFDNDTVVIFGELRCDMDFNAAYAELDFSRLVNSARIVTDLFPFLATVFMNRAWAGIDGLSTDKTFILDFCADVPKLIYSCGFSASGFQLGSATGRAVANLILDGVQPNRYHWPISRPFPRLDGIAGASSLDAGPVLAQKLARLRVPRAAGKTELDGLQCYS